MIKVEENRIIVEGYMHENIMDLAALFIYILNNIAEEDEELAKGVYDAVNLATTRFLKDVKGHDIGSGVDEVNGAAYLMVMAEAFKEHKDEMKDKRSNDAKDPFAKLFAEAIDNADWKGE
jgi:hypothetical protein